VVWIVHLLIGLITIINEIVGAYPEITAILDFSKKQSFSPNFDEVRFNFGNNDEMPAKSSCVSGNGLP